MRAVLADALADAGLTAVEAGNAHEALSLLTTETFGLVITDLKMPGTIDGVGLVAWIRDARPGTPVIVITAFHKARHELETSVPVFEKPFRVEALLERVHQMLLKPR